MAAGKKSGFAAAVMAWPENHFEYWKCRQVGINRKWRKCCETRQYD